MMTLLRQYNESVMKEDKHHHGCCCTTRRCHPGKAAAIRRRLLHTSFRWWHAIFIFSAISLFICLLQIFLPPPFGILQPSEQIAQQPFSDGCAEGVEYCICPRETVCAEDWMSMILLILARCSAFFDYPLYMMMFLTKAHNINDALRRTILREWVEFSDLHDIHAIFGIVVGIETMSHSFFHLLRWGLNANIQLLWQSRTGISGLIACTVTPLIVWPMALPFLKRRMSFELRKFLHYLSWAWALALVYHAPYRIYWLIGIPALVYLVDWFVSLFPRNHLIETMKFERNGESGVVVSFQNPSGFDCTRASYIYLLLPWLSKYQWHAFSVFPNPTEKNCSTVYIKKSGDWTESLYSTIRFPVYKPGYCIGPFRSPFSDSAIKANSCIAVASGIGIAPTLSLVQAYQETKRVNIVWVCRDPGLIEYILQKVDLRAMTKYSFVLIFYTGKRELALPRHLPANFFLFRTRPNLERTIAGIVTCVESGNDLPEEMYMLQEEISDISFERRVKIGLAKIASAYSHDELFDYAVEKTEEKKNEVHGRDRYVPSPPSSSSYISARSGDASSADAEDGSERYVSQQGFESTIKTLLDGIGDYSSDDIDALFQSVAAEGSARIRKQDFVQFFDMRLGVEDEAILDKVEKGFDRITSMSSLSGRDKLALETLDRHMTLSSCRNSSDNLRGMDGHQVPMVIANSTDDVGIGIRAAWVEGFTHLKGNEEQERPKMKTRSLSKVERGLRKSSSLADFAALPTGSMHSSTWGGESLPDDSTCTRSTGRDAFGGDDSIEYLYMLSQEDDRPLKSWGIFYCGASPPIENVLKKIKQKYGITLSIEKFDW